MEEERVEEKAEGKVECLEEEKVELKVEEKVEGMGEDTVVEVVPVKSGNRGLLNTR